MAKFAVIKNGKIVNVIDADADFTIEGFELVEETLQTGAAHITGTYKNGVFIAPISEPIAPLADLEARIPAPALGDA